jgi:hypothetical protein
VLAAQALIDDALEHRRRDFFTDMRALSVLVLKHGTLEDLGRPSRPLADGFSAWCERRAGSQERRAEQLGQGKSFRVVERLMVTPRTPENAGLCAAISTRMAKNVASEALWDLRDFVDELLDRSQITYGLRNTTAYVRALGGSPELHEMFETLLTTRGKWTPRLRKLRVESVLEPRNVPQLLWPSSFSQIRPLIPMVVSDDFARRFCSTALVFTLGVGDWSEAVQVLGLPRTTSNVMRCLEQTKRAGTLQEVFERLANVARQPPVIRDYAAVRTALCDLTHVDAEAWEAMCEGHFHRRLRPTWRQYAAVWLWTDATEGDYRLAPALVRLASDWGCRPHAIQERYRNQLATCRLDPIKAQLRLHGDALLSLAGVMVGQG